ncbi:hypothetical protein WJX73_001955 [Symbiochloris irregularis]|uniref:Ubiquinone biosynthesis protein n=1 Tax=Symbiochloris irregularis TaxID=706552 RepID=A0AAW1NWL4_9CHLO
MALWRSSKGLQSLSSTARRSNLCRHCFAVEYATAIPPEAAQPDTAREAEEDSKIDREAAEAAQKLVSSMLRANLTAEAASARLFAGQSSLRPRAEDARYFKEKGEALWEQVKLLAPQHRTRPSLLAPAARAAAFGLGAASACLPGNLRATIGGAMQDAIVEQYNDHLRELRQAGLAEEMADVRASLRDLRDEERAPESTVQAPDLMKLQDVKSLTFEEGLAGAVKYGFKALFSASQRI